MDKYLSYCQGDILLTTEGNIPFGNPPLDFQPWQHVTDLTMPSSDGSQDTDTIHIHRLDTPVTGIEGLRMEPLRKTHSILSPQDYALAGKGAELVYWDSTTRFCGCCGGETRWMTPISKKCRECGKEWWPSPATAIIVRIDRGDEILLVKAHNFRTNHYGLVAGFVETGESLEEAVLREVQEETGLKIRDLKYFGSQTWPYPMGLMVGFTAKYESGELKLQREELQTAGWFTRDNLPPIPDKASIARWLIDAEREN